jgi:hypothetical protein
VVKKTLIDLEMLSLSAFSSPRHPTPVALYEEENNHSASPSLPAFSSPPHPTPAALYEEDKNYPASLSPPPSLPSFSSPQFITPTENN